MAITAALESLRVQSPHLQQTKWSRVMTPATNTTSKKMREPVREPTRELTEDELAYVSGGIIAILAGNRAPTDLT
jgi:hypothetical protein